MPALRPDTLRIEPPEIFSLNRNYADSVDFLNKIREETSKKQTRRFVVDLQTTKHIGPAAGLCLVAELDRWQRINKKKLSPLTLDKWDLNVRRYLFSMGFFQLLGTRVPVSLRTKGDAMSPIWLPYFSSTIIKGTLPKILRHHIERQLGSLGDLRQALYGPLIEAIKNAVEHAYPDELLQTPDSQRVGPRWWMLGVAQPLHRRIRVIIFDQGTTIPGSLPTSSLWEDIKHMVLSRGDTDRDRIATAVQYGKTRTGLEGRGKGLAEMVGLAERDPTNHIRIYSRSGFYHVVGNSPFVSEGREVPLSGTLIQWDLQVPET